MGNYNPNKPYILGMEWAPLTGDPAPIDTGTEYGYSFTVTGAPFKNVISFTSAYQEPVSSIAGQTVLFSIYPQGREDDTGEIRVTRIPVTTAFVTGAIISGAASATSALLSTSDNSFILFDSTADKLRVTIDDITSSIIPTDARILGIDLLYQVAGTPGFVLEPTIESNTVIYPYGPYITGPASLAQVSTIDAVSLGDVDPWWSVTGGPNTTSERIPWRHPSMRRWSSAGTGGQLYIGIRVSTLPLSGFIRLGYLAMNVYWCTESRVAYGGTAYGQDPNNVLSFRAISSIADVTARDPVTLAQSVSLPVGGYTVTTTMADAGAKYNAGDHIRIPFMYQYAPVSTHPTSEITKFKRPSGILPAIAPISAPTNFMRSVHMGSATTPTYTELQGGMASFIYMGLEGAPVWLTPAGLSVFATQEIHNEASASDTSYEWVRFYARRFNPEAVGDLTVTVAGSGSATITSTEFASIEELIIADPPGSGWKEVTLPITAVFSSDASFRNVTFTMTGVASSTSIDQYQIMVVRTPITNKYTTPLSVNPNNAESRYDGLQLASLTYVSPEDDTPTVPALSTRATAVVMFAQSLPAPTGVAAGLTSMPVSGIGQGCNGVPACIPTSIYANRLTWNAIPVTGAFSHYEIQREDDLAEWQTIAYITGHHTLEFTDWEARVGMESDYRIRSVNVSDFAGPWSSTFSSTIPSPGIGGAGSGNSTLIFTSNQAPTGSLAYIMQFEGEPVEEFTFPEAGQVELQTRYQKNFFTAHHGTERGGEQFTRTVLVQGAAIAAPSMGNTFSLRDLAWASLPYVCVRDELGNRWLANVQVPSTRVRANRQLYFAEISISEVTDTPAVVTS